MNCSKKKMTTGMALALGITLVAVGLLFGAQTASAQVNGPTISPSDCMQRVFIGTTGNVTNSNKLNCTANDIRLSRAISVSPATCNEGETFTLTATFETIVTANSRYDGGFFFRTDGGANARGDGTTASGTCSLSELTPGVSPALPQGGTGADNDTCGDLNAGTYNLTFTIPNVLCHDSDGDGKLNLPNCTSWHSNQGTACTIGNEFDFHPDTKSKCVCDDTFQVPVRVETATLAVVKEASPTSVPEPGGEVTYTVTITNQASSVSVTIKSINDDLYGNLGTNSPSHTPNTCPSLINVVLAPGGSANCSFKATASGNSGATVTDVVTVCGNDSAGHTGICNSDDAAVTITDVFTAPTLAKTAQSATCTADVSYQVVVSNNSTIDTLTVNSLSDDKFGLITAAHIAGGGFAQVVSTECNTGSVIAASSNYTCSFVGRIVSTSCDFTHTNTATANVTDDDGQTSTPSSKSVTVTVSKTFSTSP